MNAKFFLTLSLFIVLISNCVVVSFYPLYTDKDVITDDRVIGKWISTSNSTQFNDTNPNIWEISFPEILEADDHAGGKLQYKNKATYQVKTYSKEHPDAWVKFWLHIVELKGQKYADIYPTDWEIEENDILLVHRLSVHSIAKIKIGEKIDINWMNPEWLNKLFDQNKIRIRHENNGWNILLTAKPEELQKFLIKYSDGEAAYKDGYFHELIRMN